MRILSLLISILAFWSAISVVKSEDAYKYYTWTVTYGTASPLGFLQQVCDQGLRFPISICLMCVLLTCVWVLRGLMFAPKFVQVILINGQFPGPKLDCVTNDNIILNLINKLDQPFLLTWWSLINHSYLPLFFYPILDYNAEIFCWCGFRNGIKQRKNSWQDGVLGTNCPIPPRSNYTYKFQTKDQIGSYTYFPSTGMHRAAGGFGALNVYARSVIPVPYAKPAGDFTLLIGDWYITNHKVRLPVNLICRRWWKIFILLNRKNFIFNILIKNISYLRKTGWMNYFYP